jgi:hypothetical protein
VKTPWLSPPLFLLLVAGALATAGCQQTAWLLVQIVRPWVEEETVEAQYDLKDKSLLILVDIRDPALASEYPRLPGMLGEAVARALTEHKACAQIVPIRSLEAIRKSEPGFEDWSVAQVGKYFNVDLVLHVRVHDFRLRDDPTSNVYHGYGETALCLVAPETGEQVWPVLASARLMAAETMPGVEAESLSEQENILVDGIGEKLARLFYTYKIEDISLHPKVK